MDEEKTILLERLRTLPEPAQQAITQGIWADRVQAIAKNFKLNEEQEKALETETLLVMLGLEQPTDYVFNIEESVDVSTEMARNLVDAIDRDVWTPLVQTLPDTEASSEQTTQELKHTVSPPANLPTGKGEVGHVTHKTVITPASNATPQTEAPKAGREWIEEEPTFTRETREDTPVVNTTQETQLEQPVKATEPSKEETKKPQHVDPYREPIE